MLTFLLAKLFSDERHLWGVGQNETAGVTNSRYIEAVDFEDDMANS